MSTPISCHQLPLADLQIDANFQSIISRSGREITLRRKEFQLLKFLANNLNSVISKYAILDLVWEFSSFAGSNTLEVHLSSLRKKIQKISQQVRIDTIRGVGYRLTTDKAINSSNTSLLRPTGDHNLSPGHRLPEALLDRV